MTIMIPFPRCLHRISCVHLPPGDDDDDNNSKAKAKAASGKRRHGRSTSLIKLVKSDGGVETYDRPIKAWELMEEFPKHMVCRSDCFYIGQKTPALSQHDRLQPGHNYFLLPANFFQSDLSFATVLRCRSAFSGRSSFEVEKTPSGSLRIKVFEDVLFQQQQVEATTSEKSIIRVCTTPQLRKDYEQLVGRQRMHHWKPKLDTIAEKKNKKIRNKKLLH
ncbi:hypothetical protein BUALT_Bualt17G0006000 [Buddleja alternifolia]|uniref:Uncharacterized protein n=1 Tax=Buddleja alternifolia TaxID=168488 RepID=A0AAV6W5U4_9LAMI|nr:hypothetical protein BUALT_Bualt17G0006000 [Buddleja alternifolia]